MPTELRKGVCTGCWPAGQWEAVRVWAGLAAERTLLITEREAGGSSVSVEGTALESNTGVTGGNGLGQDAIAQQGLRVPRWMRGLVQSLWSLGRYR